ncbi:hypothetical protein [Nesterenkonia pannonica]|uniref:hypothetical protein n=1 Tax=Nesterenkonia pannonica TaxID=1548602 RepID=UPI002164BFA5|nr:hypothetical protein [Nesterenkonia pannonica]
MPMEQLAERPAPTPDAPQRARPTGLRKRRPAEGARSRIHGLDGLRALAVVLVIVYHINPRGPRADSSAWMCSS